MAKSFHLKEIIDFETRGSQSDARKTFDIKGSGFAPGGLRLDESAVWSAVLQLDRQATNESGR